MRLIIFTFCLIFCCHSVWSQRDFYKNHSFTEADTLRGMLRPERTCYDVTFYDLNIKVDVPRKYISGYVDMYFDVLSDFEKLQIDLFENMKLNKIELGGDQLNFERKHNAVFVQLPPQIAGTHNSIRIFYEGHPIIAKRAPWDGGFVWSKDNQGNPWVGVACEGTGASLWWPNKDHLSDEPDSMSIRVAVPDPLTCIANGNLRNIEKEEAGYTRFDWFVSYPINNYNVTVNIGDYVHFSDTIKTMDKDLLPLDYYVISNNEKKARKHFQQVPQVLRCFEYYFGAYPFIDDGYALVETPYLGMEHQSAIAYGNKYMRGYLGGMIPRDMDWDYIIVHETGHEYFGNSISCYDLSEMWIHESFTTYTEALYVECTYGYEDAVRYLNHFRSFPTILNEEPILGPKDVNWENWSGSDHYFKGSWMLHTLRHALNNDELWFDILKSFHQENRITNVYTEDFIEFVKNKSKATFIDTFFEQYLWHPNLPILKYNIKQEGQDLKITCQWTNCVNNFNMPVQVGHPDSYQLIQPDTKSRTFHIPNCKKKDFKIATELFLIDTRRK